MNLDISEWKEFSLLSLFTIERGTRLIKERRFAGNTPLITAGFQNEGVSEYINSEDNILYSGEKITIDMFGNAFFRSYSFYCDDNILVLSPKTEISKFALLFITTIINLDSYRYSYGRQYRQKDSRKHYLKLPVRNDDSPDFVYMEKYITSLYVKPITTKIKSKIFPRIIFDGWKEFRLDELFKIKYGINLELQTLQQYHGKDSNSINFVARIACNNGVAARVKRIPELQPQPPGVITCAAGGSVLSTFVQLDEFYSGRDLYLLYPKYEMDIFAKLFCCTLIRANKYKYAYGRQANKTMPSIKIKLPITKDGLPDFKEISNYMKRLSYSDRIEKDGVKNVNKYIH